MSNDASDCGAEAVMESQSERALDMTAAWEYDPSRASVSGF
jgi:hypothetical protein